MVFINDKRFDDIPGSCGTCPFYQIASASPMFPSADKGWCFMFSENHHSYINPPARCMKLFRSAMKFPEGYRLVIVNKEND